MNTPYVKKYNEKGELLNPIKGRFINRFPNRMQRRLRFKDNRFTNNSKGTKLVVIGSNKFYQQVQVEYDEKGNRKLIEHSITKVPFRLQQKRNDKNK